MWQIYVPAIALIQELDRDHLVYRWRFLTFLIWSVMSFVCVPLLMIAALGEKYRRQFIYSYVKNLLDKSDERQD